MTSGVDRPRQKETPGLVGWLEALGEWATNDTTWLRMDLRCGVDECAGPRLGPSVHPSNQASTDRRYVDRCLLCFFCYLSGFSFRPRFAASCCLLQSCLASSVPPFAQSLSPAYTLRKAFISRPSIRTVVEPSSLLPAHPPAHIHRPLPLYPSHPAPVLVRVPAREPGQQPRRRLCECILDRYV